MEKIKRWIAFFLLMIAAMAIAIALPATYNSFTGKLDYYGLQNQTCGNGQYVWGFNDSLIMCRPITQGFNLTAGQKICADASCNGSISGNGTNILILVEPTDTNETLIP